TTEAEAATSKSGMRSSGQPLLNQPQIKAKVATFGFGGPTEVLLVATYAFKLYASACLNIRRIGLVKKGEK
ncbi:hypothetical protein ACJX0J_017263, partial [Zea mays]